MLGRLMVIVMALALGAFASFAFVSCGGDDDDEGSDSVTEADDGGGGSLDEESEGVGSDENTKDYTIIATDFSFSTDHLEVDAGNIIVELDNQGSAPHTFSVYRDQGYSDLAESTGNVAAGTNKEQPMSLDAGDYFVRCDVHPTQMEMTLSAITTP